LGFAQSIFVFVIFFINRRWDRRCGCCFGGWGCGKKKGTGFFGVFFLGGGGVLIHGTGDYWAAKTL
ncbi:hypothetical protein ACJ41I_08640, partial [Bifidobacterium catenulatum]|uniref:hypothetical protein n=1 Tax=Bifidobacterium catenulatum TaxID=1686 RepID=UPI003D32BF1B